MGNCSRCTRTKEKILKHKTRKFLPYILVFLFADDSSPSFTQNIWDPQVYMEEFYSYKIMLLNIAAECCILFIIKSLNLLTLNYDLSSINLRETQSLSCALVYLSWTPIHDAKARTSKKELYWPLAHLEKQISKPFHNSLCFLTSHVPLRYSTASPWQKL